MRVATTMRGLGIEASLLVPLFFLGLSFTQLGGTCQ